MGAARRRGTFEERKAAAIKAGRVKTHQPFGLRSGPALFDKLLEATDVKTRLERREAAAKAKRESFD